MIDTTEAGDSKITEEQAAAATLRELFLKAIGELNGRLILCLILYYWLIIR